MSERTEIQAWTLEYLKAHNILYERRNTGRRGGVSFGKPGYPDIFAVFKGHHIEIECKVPKGGLSEGQKVARAEILNSGASYLLAKTPDDVTGFFAVLLGYL